MKARLIVTRAQSLILSLSLFLLVLGLGISIIQSSKQDLIQERRKVAVEIGNTRVVILKHQLDHLLSSTLILASVLRQDEGIYKFDILAQDILKTHRGISSLQLAPNGVITQVYPSSDYEGFIGFDLLSSSKAPPEASAAIISKKLTLAGPLTLEKDMKLLGCLPVFLPDTSGKDRFWGFIIAWIRLSDLLQTSNLDQLIEDGYDYELSHISLNNDQRIVLARSSEVPGTDLFHSPDAISFSIQIPNGKWILSFLPRGGWEPSSSFIEEYSLIVLVGLLISFLTYFSLRQEVELSTQKFAETPAKLKNEISESQRMEEISQFTQFFIDHAHIAAFGIGSDGGIFYVNKAACDLLGYAKEELLGLKVYDLDLGFSKETWSEDWQEMKQRRSFIFESHNRTKDGGIFPVEVFVNQLEFKGKEYLFACIRDITERKQVQEYLRESEERYRAVVEQAIEGIFLWDLKTKYVLESNLAFQNLLGYTAEELLKLTIYDLVAHDREDVDFNIQQLLRKRHHNASLRQYRHKDGSLLDVEVNTHLISYRGREVACVVIHDITQHRKLEAQLRQSQKMEAIGRLAGGVAHDFNNILTAILLYSELALGHIENQDALRKDIEEIKKAGQRAVSLTRQLLAFSRKQVLQPVILDLNTVVADMDKMLQRVIGEDIELVTILSPKLGYVKADPGQIEQVILNLAINSRDAMPQGGKLIIETANVSSEEIQCYTKVSITPGPYVMLAITDTGMGMDLETQSHLFEPFFTTKEQGKGTGLGLATVYGIVKQSGGYIWVYSELGRGTTFKIYLPQAEGVAQLPRNDQIFIETPRGSETILLVEDEEAVRALTCQILMEKGYTVLQARDGEEALSICQQYLGPIHLMITDVVMPRMSGRVLAEQVSLIRPSIKVLYMSGYPNDAAVLQDVLKMNMIFLQKPFTPDTLACKVREVLEVPWGIFQKEKPLLT
jgi:PAS domain S-box-containing protein